MKNQNAARTKIQLLLLLGIGVMAPLLYAQCVTQQSCVWSYGDGTGSCIGSTMAGSSYAGDADWLEGDGACGERYNINGQDMHETCGPAPIVTECA